MANYRQMFVFVSTFYNKHPKILYGLLFSFKSQFIRNNFVLSLNGPLISPCRLCLFFCPLFKPLALG